MAKRTKKQLAEGCMEAGTRVKMSEQGIKEWDNSYANPANAVGIVTEDLPPTYGNEWGFVVRVQWPDGTVNSYKKGDLDVVADEVTREEKQELYVIEAADSGYRDEMCYNLRTAEEEDEGMPHEDFVLVKKAPLQDAIDAGIGMDVDPATGIWANMYHGDLMLVERVNKPGLQQWVKVDLLEYVH